MEVILLEKIVNLGSLGEIVNVRSGYARNYLVPQRKAKIATPSNLAEFETIRAELEAAEADSIAHAERRKSTLEALSIHLVANAGQEGKLFGSITNIDIANAIAEQDVEVERKEIRMPADGPIRNVGEFEVLVHLHSDVDAVLNVTVSSADADTDAVTSSSDAADSDNVE